MNLRNDRSGRKYLSASTEGFQDSSQTPRQVSHNLLDADYVDTVEGIVAVVVIESAADAEALHDLHRSRHRLKDTD